jgi:putative ABC transport system permease protein
MQPSMQPSMPARAQWRLALTMLGRDWRAGEIGFLLLALMLAVASLSSVSFFADRIRNGLQRDAHQLLGADLLLSRDRPLPEAWRAAATRNGLLLADTVVFPSMAFNPGGAAKLASIKAVSPGYPLRGQLKISHEPQAEGESTRSVPQPGTVWVDANLLRALNLQVGQSLQLGERQFQVAQVLISEPDRGALFMNFAPRVMLNLSDLASTQLLQPGARVTYRLLLADGKRESGQGSAPVAQFRGWLKTQMALPEGRGIELEALDTARPEMRATLDRAERFLSLVSLLSTLLAALAIALAARRFMLRHLTASVMLRFLGMTGRQATTLFLLEFLLLGLAGSLLGALTGFAAHFVLLQFLGQFVTAQLPAPGLLPALQAFVTGMVLLLGFAVPPLLQLRNATLNRILRRESDPPQAITVLGYAAGTLAFIALLVWQAGEVKLGLITAGGFLLGTALFCALGWLSLRALGLLRHRTRSTVWRFALTSLQRRPAASVVQIVALALGLMALLLLSVVRGELVAGWRSSAPPDAPNRFLVGIQPEQKEAVAARLKQGGVNRPLLFPMMRARLVRINQEPTNGPRFQKGPQRRFLEREFNISTLRELPPQNEVVAGRWFDPEQAGQVSVEQSLADNLGLHLGDRLEFDVAGQIQTVTVSSVRKLDWGSMRVNFYFILSPPGMQALPHSFLTAFYLPPQSVALGDQLARDFPNLTLVDTGQILRQVQAILNQVIAAVEFLFLFTLAAGGLVLYAVLQSSQDERRREAGLLRALGATRLQLARAQRIEFLFIGTLAGALAAGGAALCGFVLARQVFEFAWQWRFDVWLIGIVAGVACALLGGWLGLRGVLAQPPLQTLREAM